MRMSQWIGAGFVAMGLTLAAGAAMGDEGTALSVSNFLTSVACLDTASAQVSVSTVLNTTGSVDSAVVTRSIDGNGETQIGVIQPQQFEHDGRNKSARFDDTVTLANGTHTLTYCFTQSGARGREPKRTCGSVTVVVDCAPDTSTCGSADFFFGNIVNNPAICNAKGGTPNIPVHLKADAIGDVELTIQGPNGFSLTTVMNRAGESCNYHFNWNARTGNGGAGSYTFSATDESGEIAATTELLYCN